MELDRYQLVYQSRASDYDRLVEAEDYEQNVRRALEAAADWRGARVIEVGMGTGRLSRLAFRAGISHFWGVDASNAMLDVARKHLEREAAQLSTPPAWSIAVADARSLPRATASADIAMAGWVFGHFTTWFAPQWRVEVERALAELERVVGPQGTCLVAETLGTGVEVPGPPHERLGDYYHMLETDWGYQRVVVRTDYQFESAHIAAEICRVFFGDALADRILERGWARVPEWTGLWVRKPA